MTILETMTEKAARQKGEERKIFAEKIENFKKIYENLKKIENISNAKTYLIRCYVDAAPRELERFVKPRSER